MQEGDEGGRGGESMSNSFFASSQELQKFCRYIVAGFFHMASKNPLVFVELLLWKTSRDVFELTEGYGTVERERSEGGGGGGGGGIGGAGSLGWGEKGSTM